MSFFQDPIYSTPVQAPPTQMWQGGGDDDEDVDTEEPSGQEVETTTATGKQQQPL